MATEVSRRYQTELARTGCAFKWPVPTKISALCVVIAFAFGLNGCSSMSAQARRERAYHHYVSKQMRQRQKQMARAQKAANREMKRKMKLVEPSEPKLTTSIEDVSSDNYPSVFDPVAQPAPATSSRIPPLLQPTRLSRP